MLVGKKDINLINKGGSLTTKHDINTKHAPTKPKQNQCTASHGCSRQRGTTASATAAAASRVSARIAASAVHPPPPPRGGRGGEADAGSFSRSGRRPVVAGVGGRLESSGWSGWVGVARFSALRLFLGVTPPPRGPRITRSGYPDDGSACGGRATAPPAAPRGPSPLTPPLLTSLARRLSRGDRRDPPLAPPVNAVASETSDVTLEEAADSASEPHAAAWGDSTSSQSISHKPRHERWCVCVCVCVCVCAQAPRGVRGEKEAPALHARASFFRRDVCVR